MGSRVPDLDQLSRDELLDLRMCDLEVSIQGTRLEGLITTVRGELERRHIVHRPHFWLADEWFSPEGAPGVGIPFYLAHPRLRQLELAQMYEVEGGTRRECLMLLRHETGHALDTAYGLSRRKRWRELFGRPGQPYPEFYRPRPVSKRYVQHLAGWYAQSHPTEDFAETFAVWLDPRSRWRTRYQGWHALKKLEYVDGLMKELADRPPRVRSRARPYSLAKLRHTLRTHYERKRAHFDVGYSEAYDTDLKRLFCTDTGPANPTAASLLRRRRRLIRERVARWTGAYEFEVDQLLKEVIGRCRELQLRIDGNQADAVHEFTVLMAVHVTHQLRGSNWHAM